MKFNHIVFIENIAANYPTLKLLFSFRFLLTQADFLGLILIDNWSCMRTILFLFFRFVRFSSFLIKLMMYCKFKSDVERRVIHINNFAKSVSLFCHIWILTANTWTNTTKWHMSGIPPWYTLYIYLLRWCSFNWFVTT